MVSRRDPGQDEQLFFEREIVNRLLDNEQGQNQLRGYQRAACGKHESEAGVVSADRGWRRRFRPRRKRDAECLDEKQVGRR